MVDSTTDGVQLAEGFRFTDRLTAPYRLAYGHVQSPCSAIYLVSLDGSQTREILGEDLERRRFTACFSPDGSALYYYDGQLHAKDLATGSVHTLTDIPIDPPFDDLHLLECSPDNRILLFTQTATPQFVRGVAPVSPVRLCRVGTDGTGFRVLYEDAADCHLSQAVCGWRQRFVLLERSNTKPDKVRGELGKVNVESGEWELVGSASDLGWNLTLRPDGTQIAWSALGQNVLYIRSLVDAKTPKRFAPGTCPAWSPDGKQIAFMKDEYVLSLLDVESEHTQDLVWFEPPNLTYKQRRSGYAVTPVWSPDSRMLWFSITQTRKLPPVRSLSQALREAKRYVYPILHNLDPNRTSHHVGYHRHYHTQRIGILDFATRQVMLSKGFFYGVVWLPEPARL